MTILEHIMVNVYYIKEDLAKPKVNQYSPGHDMPADIK